MLKMEYLDPSPIDGGYVVMPRHIAQDSRNGIISNPERNLLMWVRVTADIRGVSHCSMRSLADEAFNDRVSVSYINKLLRSLKRKRYLWYEDRNGRRGVFEVHLPDWFLKNGTIKSIDHLYEKRSVRARSELVSEDVMQFEPVLEDVSHRIVERERPLKTKFF